MKTLAGTGGLMRLILRRDRVILPIWIVVLCVIPISYVNSFADLYPTAESRQQYADNAGFITLYGQLSGTSLGEFITWRVGFVPVIVGLISLLTVIRHTRVEEETGRSELLGSSVVGRHAGLAAALLTTFGANLVLAVLLALGMQSQDLPLAGSVAIGLEFLCCRLGFRRSWSGRGAAHRERRDGTGNRHRRSRRLLRVPRSW